MKRDLSQETKIIIDKAGKAVTASDNIEGKVIDLMQYNDVMVHAEAILTAGRVDMKIETSPEEDFSKDVEEIKEEAIKTIVDGDKLIREDKKKKIGLYFTSTSDKKLVSDFGIIKDVVTYRYMRITYVPNASASVATTGLSSVVILNKEYAPSGE